MRPNRGVQRTGVTPAADAESFGSRIMRPLLAAMALLGLSACASHGELFVSVRDVGGGPIPGVAVTAGRLRSVSDAHGMASFSSLESGRYDIDATVSGMKSCGPLRVNVHGSKPAETTLYFRLATIADGVETFIGPDGTTHSRPASWLEYEPCPGRPETAIKVKTCCDSPEKAHRE